ncbi:MAG: histidine kinase [Anaerolineales bacterium]|nr:histidine kinase [Anaerolineales bacterium]
MRPTSKMLYNGAMIPPGSVWPNWIANRTRRTQHCTLRLLWWSLAPLAVALSIAGVPARLRQMNGGTLVIDYANLYLIGLELLLAATFFVAGGFVVWKRYDDSLAIFLGIVLFMVGATEVGMTDAIINPEFSNVWWIWRGPVLLMRALAMIGSLILLYVFPDGRFVPGMARWLAVIWTALTFVWLLFPNVPFNTIYGPTWRATPVASFLVAVAWFSTGILAQIYRYRLISDRHARQRTEWMAVGLIAAVLGGVFYYGIAVVETISPGFLGHTYWWLRRTLQVVLMALLPVCIAIAILRYRLFDIDILVNRTLVYGTLTTLVVALYLVVVGGLNQFVAAQGNWAIALVATGMVAVLFQPLRLWLQRGVNRLMYGERDDPYAVLTRLGRRLESAVAPDLVLASVAATIAQALRLPYAAIAIDHDGKMEIAAEFGIQPSGELYNLALNYQGTPTGQLLLAQRAPNDFFSPADRHLLDDLARQAAVAVYAARLTVDIQRSRERLVSAREEERRRLRRDLHDGLGPTLASLSFRLDAARNMLARDPSRADTLLAAASDQLHDAISDIRRLVYNLRPPALDQLGLVGALREHLIASPDSSVLFTIDAPEVLPALPAAVEVAAYRIVQEATTNVLRHSHASRCIVHLVVTDSELKLEITDNGTGLGSNQRIGVGRHAMLERLPELGWSLGVRGSTRARLTVSVRLPLAQ